MIKLRWWVASAPRHLCWTALGQHGVNIGEFVKRFNDATGDRVGKVLPVEITVFNDRSLISP